MVVKWNDLDEEEEEEEEGVKKETQSGVDAIKNPAKAAEAAVVWFV